MNGFAKNDPNKKFSLTDRLKSFKYAFSGLVQLFRFEHNIRVHMFILVIVIFAGIFLRVSTVSWIAIVFASGLVFVSECFNTAIEYLSDAVTPDQNEKIKKVKDVAAAGVLISAIISVIIGIIVFLPEILKHIDS
jgi:diacylglycerol kinase